MMFKNIAVSRDQLAKPNRYVVDPVIEEYDSDDEVYISDFEESVVPERVDIMDTPSYSRFNGIPERFEFMQNVIATVYAVDSMNVQRYSRISIVRSELRTENERGEHTVYYFDRFNNAHLEILVDQVTDKSFRLLYVAVAK